MFCQISGPLLDAFRKFRVSHMIYHTHLFCLSHLVSALNGYVNHRCCFQAVLTAACVWDAKLNGVHHCTEIGRILSSLALYHTVINFTVLSSSRHNTWLSFHRPFHWNMDTSILVVSAQAEPKPSRLNPSQAGCQPCSLWILCSGLRFKSERFCPEGKGT